MSKYQFVNPYNFIPLSSGRAAAPAEEKGYTGVIRYSVLTKTPLFIPNTSNSDAFGMQQETADHKSYDFFTYTDLSSQTGTARDAMPVIPGSEMRGMIRSNFEILTNSCMSAVDDEVTLSKRTNEVFQTGLIRRNAAGTFDLYEAEDCLMRTRGKDSLEDDWADDSRHYSRKCYVQNDVREGSHVYFEMERRGYKVKSLAKNVSLTRRPGLRSEGYIIKGEDGPDMGGRKQQKHCCHVFACRQNSRPYRENISLETLEKVLREYKNNKEHPYEEYGSRFAAFRKGQGEEYFPVYYSHISKNGMDCLMLSPACITREIYSTKIKDMIGDHRPCSDKNNLCPACALFGTVKTRGKGDAFSVTSRIRFSDLVCREKSAEMCYDRKVTLPPLSSPKLNNMEFYLQRPAEDAVFWTYDYYINAKGEIFPNRSGISGRKFFWHNPDYKLEQYKPGNQNMTIRPVKAGIVFTGKLYFQNLTKTELDQLIFVLNAGDEAQLHDKNHGYKLGGAKPLGLGSIALSVDEVMLRKIVKNTEARSVERQEIAYQGYAAPEFDAVILENFLKMADFYAAADKKVCYPFTDKRDDEGHRVIFDWFVQNHVRKEINGSYTNKMPNSRMQMAYAEYLEAMEPETKPTGKRNDLAESRMAGGKQSYRTKRTPPAEEKRQESGNAGKEPFVRGKNYQAEITGCNRKNIFLTVEGQKGQIYYRSIREADEGQLDQLFYRGQKITVRYDRSSEYQGRTSYSFRWVK